MNIFLTLGAVLCLGTFALLWIAAMFLSDAIAGILTRFKIGRSWIESASFLLWLRMFPTLFALAVTLALVLPAFLKLEPRQTWERPESYLVVLAAFGVFLLAMLAFRVIRLCWATVRIVHAWQLEAQQIGCCDGVPVFRVAAPGSVFAVAGILKPRIFIGDEAQASLAPEELRAAIAHEVAHVRSFDNLKRLLLSVTRVPALFSSLRAVDSAWAEAAECAADQQVVIRQGIPALELSSAIVKIARLRAVGDWSHIAASHLVMPGQTSAMSQRLRRLRLLLENPSVVSKKPSRSKLAPLVAVAIIVYLMELPSLLAITHRAMESLVQ